MFRVLTPDAQYDDNGTIERATAGDDFSFDILRERDAERIPAELFERADALLVWHELAIDASLVARLERCRIIVRAGVGFDHINLEAAGRAGIPVCNTPDYGTSEVADHAIALWLGLRRGVTLYDQRVRADAQGSFVPFNAPLVRRVRGSRFGIVGLGRIGTATALRAQTFGCRVVAFDPYLPRGQEIALGVERVESLNELLRSCDAVSLHAPLNDETRNIIDAEALAHMQSHAVLINTARGALVDVDALFEALKVGRLGGAGLDVLPQEPPDPEQALLLAAAQNPSWLQSRLLLSPHAAWYSPESQTDARRFSTQTLMAYLRHRSLRNCVNTEFLTSPRTPS